MKADLSGTWQCKQGNTIIDEFTLTRDMDNEHYKMTYESKKGEVTKDYFGMGTEKVLPGSRSGTVLNSKKFTGSVFTLVDNPDKLIIKTGKNTVHYVVSE